jgi:hypothetical protein
MVTGNVYYALDTKMIFPVHESVITVIILLSIRTRLVRFRFIFSS